ncbi:MAG TPA: DUF6044 family protein, partial [Ohtaekwangia sp.]|uniref:DUF6044 family protein n=1 Tax=Ohtaekwangia sp. TaxID=2066019 RepID=UPI002F93B89F
LVYLQVLKISGNLLGVDGSPLVYNIFNGINRGSFHSEFSIIRILFYILPSFWAYVTNSILVRCIGFTGIYLLARDYFPDSRKTAVFVIGIAFALLPLYTLYGVSVMGQPLLLWAFLNIKEKRSVMLSFILIVLYPFYAHFAFVGPFILAALVVYGIYSRFILKSEVNILYWTGIAALLVFFIIANINIIASFFLGTKPSHREDWTNAIPSFSHMVKLAATTLIHGQYHSATINSIPIILLIVYAVWKKVPAYRDALMLLIAIIAISGFYAFYDAVSVPLQKKFHLLTTFQFDRFTFLIPFLFTLILLVLNQTNAINKNILYTVVGVNFLLSVYNNAEAKINFSKLVVPGASKHLVTFRSFYSEKLFDQVGHYINKPKNDYRVVSLGLQPCIAQYNGFYTLDSYQNNYSMVYKKDFREVIAGELDKNRDLKYYFDHWGSRCYLFSDELKKTCYYDCRKTAKVSVKNLSINVAKLRQMGAEYIFSAVPIEGVDSGELTLQKTFEDNISSYKVYLYKL